MHVVDSYKHLGVITAIGGDAYKDTVHRVSAAMTAYSPIAVKVFGSPRVLNAVKVSFLRSLVESRLFFNIHVTVVSGRTMKALSPTYMRVVRRTRGDVTDFQVRFQLDVPSVDSIVCQASPAMRWACDQESPSTGPRPPLPP